MPLRTVIAVTAYNGKSSLLRYIASGYDHSPDYRVAVIAEQTNGPQFAFLKAISREFDIAPQRSASAQIDAARDARRPVCGKPSHGAAGDPLHHGRWRISSVPTSQLDSASPRTYGRRTRTIDPEARPAFSDTRRAGTRPGTRLGKHLAGVAAEIPTQPPEGGGKQTTSVLAPPAKR